MHPERAQAGAFLPTLLGQAGLLKEDAADAEKRVETVGQDAEKAEERRVQEIVQRYAKTDQAISELNVILVYKKVVQGLIYSPPDCDKHLGLDAEPLGPTASPLASVPTQEAPSKRLREPVCKGKGRPCVAMCLALSPWCRNHNVFITIRPTPKRSSTCS